MHVTQWGKLKMLEVESARLQRLLADATLGSAVLNEAASKGWRGFPFIEVRSRILGTYSASASIGPVPSLAWIGRRCAICIGVKIMATRSHVAALERRCVANHILGVIRTGRHIVMNHNNMRQLYGQVKQSFRRRGVRNCTMGKRVPMTLPQFTTSAGK